MLGWETGIKNASRLEYTTTTRDKLREDLDNTRERGYSIGRAEMIPGVATLGAPIFDLVHLVYAGMAISAGPLLPCLLLSQ